MAYYRNYDGMFGPEMDDYEDIFREYDFTYTEIGCDFFCPECRFVLRCEAYREIKEAWESFYI